MRLSGRVFAILLAIVGLLIVFSTDQVAPAGSPYLAQMRLWLAGRATGVCAYALVTVQVTLGLILSHPINQSTWKLSKRLFPWHENLWVFVLAFLGAHIVSLVADPYAGVGLSGAIVPGLSTYRSWPVALGTLALYALLITGLTARYTRALPAGWWLRIHRFSILIFGLAWAHGVLAGSDAGALMPAYVASGLMVLAAAVYRYWVGKARRPTFATQLEAAARPSPPATGSIASDSDRSTSA